MTGRRKRLSFFNLSSSKRVQRQRKTSFEIVLGAVFGADLGDSRSIQMGSLKTDVEKGSARTVIGRRLVGPKR